MCNCIDNKALFETVLRRVNRLKKDNDKEYGFYEVTNPKTGEKHIFTTDVETILSNKAVCCYYNSEGMKITKPKNKAPKKTSKKDDKDVQTSKA